MKILDATTALLLAMQPWPAQSACCQLAKADAELSSTQVRVCDGSTPTLCTTWLFEGTLSEDQTVPICAASETVIYQELLPSTQTWAPPIEARCDEGGRIEL